MHSHTVIKYVLVSPVAMLLVHLCPQALAVWKMARRDRAVSNKIAKLAGSPCSYEPAAVQFSLNNSNSMEDNTARDRTLGMNNRVLAGLMLHTWRSQDEQCAHSRYVAPWACEVGGLVEFGGL